MHTEKELDFFSRVAQLLNGNKIDLFNLLAVSLIVVRKYVIIIIIINVVVSDAFFSVAVVVSRAHASLR